MIPGPTVGSAAPDFRLFDTNGTAVELAGFKGKNHVVLVFNRGFM